MHIFHIPQRYIKLFNNIMLSAQPLGPLNPADYIFTRGEGLTLTPPTCYTVYTHMVLFTYCSLLTPLLNDTEMMLRCCTYTNVLCSSHAYKYKG